MRIVLVTSGLRGIGSYCLNLYKHLQKNGHEVLLVTETKWKKEHVDNLAESKSILLCDIAPIVYRQERTLKMIRDFQPDLIHYHWPCGTFDIFFKRIQNMNVPIITTLHVAVSSKEFMVDKVLNLYFGLFKRHLKHVAGVNCISEFVQGQLQSRVDLHPSKVHLRYAGIDEQIFAPTVQEKRDDDAIHLLFVGQIVTEKGIDVLINAVRRVRRHRNITLSIVGSGFLKRLLMQRTKRADYIRWIGFLANQKDVAAQYAQADLTVLPTRWDEAFSLVPLESLSCGTPVMATRKGGTPEIIMQGVTGYLLNECDEDELFKNLISLDKESLNAMRQHCRNLILERYTLTRMGQNHEELYAMVMDGTQLGINKC